MPDIRLPDRLKPVLGGPLGFLVQLVLRLSGRRAGVAVLYHRVGDPPGDPARELIPALGTAVLRAQLRHLRGAYRVVPASRLHAAAAARRRGQRFPVAITFDDDLRSHAEVALPELGRAGVPATFFLTGATLREPGAFWWERLQRAVDRGAVSAPRGIAALAEELQEATPKARAARSAELGLDAEDEPPEPGLRAGDVARLAGAGLEIGFHTLRHDTLPWLDEPELERALSDGRAELEQAAGAPLATIAYPHGRADDRVVAAARRAGFASGFTARARAVAAGEDPLRAGRVDAPPRSSGDLALTVARALARARG